MCFNSSDLRHSGGNLMNESAVFCKFRYYLAISLPELVSYYLALATMDRFFCTSENGRIRAWGQIKMVKRLSIAALIRGITMPIHIFILFDVYNNKCQISPGSIYIFVYAGYLIVVVIFLPHMLMLIFSLLTFMTLRKSRHRVMPTMIGKYKMNHREALELKFIKIIAIQISLSVSLSSLRFGTASYRNIVFKLVTPTVEQQAAQSFAESLGSSLYFLNYAVSFYASMLSSKFFREVFYERILLFYRHCVRQLIQIHLRH
ncbi:hypothetical protein I4U23_015267 [Adineta vaga]|nr:hypothetical protein I4U23_015267 [Adineta vaga]